MKGRIAGSSLPKIVSAVYSGITAWVTPAMNRRTPTIQKVNHLATRTTRSRDAGSFRRTIHSMTIEAIGSTTKHAAMRM